MSEAIHTPTTTIPGAPVPDAGADTPPTLVDVREMISDIESPLHDATARLELLRSALEWNKVDLDRAGLLVIIGDVIADLQEAAESQSAAYDRMHALLMKPAKASAPTLADLEERLAIARQIAVHAAEMVREAEEAAAILPVSVTGAA